jgi:plasmid stabilization system protein ParE
VSKIGESVWPHWKREDGHGLLAKYVSAPVATNAKLTTRLESARDSSVQEVERNRAKRLYELLRELGVIYDHEPFIRLQGAQQIRDPEWLRENRKGTCLDIATTYAAMCMAAYVDVLLAVTARHAFVVLTPGRLDGTGRAEPRRLFEIDGFEECEVGVQVGTIDALAAASGSSVVPVEPTWAAADEQLGEGLAGKELPDFETASEHALTSVADQTLWLIDVPMLQEVGGVPPLSLPGIEESIGRYMPSRRGEFRFYRGDEESIGDLRDGGPAVVLQAKQGQGKSMIARHLVEEHPFGAWFLDASEPESLILSLAMAELAEQGRPTETPDRVEREALAYNALARLRQAGSWLVVLDNADGDPTKLRKWLPAADAERFQRVLVTTTNSDWEVLMPDFEFHQLGDVAEVEVDELKGSGMVSLVRGRRLLLEAFRSLEASAGWSSEQIDAHRPAAEGKDEDSAGPAVYWAALRDSPDFGEREMRLSAFAAHLPPDHQPVALLEALVEGASTAIGMLEERGLLALDPDTASIRLHRLFGRAIRDDLDPRLRDEVVYGLAGDKAALKTIDSYGDLATIQRLDDCLAAIDADTADVDEGLGGAQRRVAGLLELHAQTRRSGDAYRRARRHLGADPILVADCLHGEARTVNQHHKSEEPLLRQAVQWSRTARQTLLDHGVDEANAARCLAMEGLLIKAIGGLERNKEDRLKILRHSLELLEEADKLRQHNDEIREDEKARSQFNLGGIKVALAKDEPERAERYLKEAENTYRQVWRRRSRLYRSGEHPHIAACIAGLSYVYYYRATLLPCSLAVRSRLLRDSTEYAVAALRQWEVLEGAVDLEEVPKSARFLTKVALARHSSPVASERKPKAVMNETIRELKAARIVFPLSPPLHREDAAAAIATWVHSVALEELVRLFAREDDEPAPGDDVAARLSWLEAFSARWDYRQGKERNLVSVPKLEATQEQLVKAAAEALGLVEGGIEPKGPYDHVLILGGLARACLARPMYTAGLLRSGEIETGSVVALGGYRELKGDELGLVEELTGEGAADEFEAMDAGIRFAFEVADPAQEAAPDDSWRLNEYGWGDGARLQVVAAPSSEPDVRPRANTPDAINWFATELAGLERGQRVLVVTTDIYVPYQQADALRLLSLPFGVEVDVAGINPGKVDHRLIRRFEAHNYLQEIRSTIRSLRLLFEALPAGG